MNDLIIKICGITEFSTAEFLIENNVDIMGFIFYTKSPRNISSEKARQILDQLKEKRAKIKVTGVFVDENIDRLRSIAQTLSLDFIQLHGNETPDYIDNLKEYSIIKAFRIKEDFTEDEILKYTNSNIKYFLTDTFQKEKPGGTGQTFNWEKFSFLKNMKNIIISGGLNKENILQAIEEFHPAGIDLNSGVEKSPGVKDKKKIAEILKLVKIQEKFR